MARHERHEVGERLVDRHAEVPVAQGGPHERPVMLARSGDSGEVGHHTRSGCFDVGVGGLAGRDGAAARRNASTMSAGMRATGARCHGSGAVGVNRRRDRHRVPL